MVIGRKRSFGTGSLKIFVFTVFLATMASVSSVAASKEKIAIYSYHTDPPFLLSDSITDISQSWVNKFNRQHSQQLELVILKRPELNALIKAGEPYLILWADKAWFRSLDHDVETTAPVFKDNNVWVSLRRRPVVYKTEKDLIGKTFGGRQGYFYLGVNALEKAGKVTRLDSLSDKENY